MRRLSTVVGVATAALVVAYLVHRRRPASRVARLVRASSAHYNAKRYEESLQAALDALNVALSEVPKSPEHLGALLHVAGVRSAMGNYEDAMQAVDQLIALTEEVHGTDSLLLIPALHAKAEVCEQSEGDGRPLALAAEQLARAREIRRAACGAHSMEYAFACFNLATILFRRVAEEDKVGPGQKAKLLAQATELAKEACSVVTVSHGQPEQAAEFASDLLELLDSDDVSKAAVDADQALRDIYLAATGEDWDESLSVPAREGD